MPQSSWRATYIELCEDVFRELGFPPPSMLHEDSLPLAMELEIGGAPFELLHTPNELMPRVLVICRLGMPSADFGGRAMRAMLKANLTLARAHAAAFGIDPDTRELRCMYYEQLGDLRAPELLEKMHKLVIDARNWLEGFLVDTAMGGRSDGSRFEHALP